MLDFKVFFVKQQDSTQTYQSDSGTLKNLQFSG